MEYREKQQVAELRWLDISTFIGGVAAVRRRRRRN
jgi:hypothetical protein